MNSLFSLLLVVTLLGAGCAQTPADSTLPASKDTNTQEQANSPTPEIEVTTETGTVAVTGNENSEGGTTAVPVTEVTLGLETETAVSMESGNYFFTPNTITAPAGGRVKITFAKNTGMHTFVLPASSINFSINEGESLLFTAPSEPGSYSFYCDIGSHKSSGMAGTLIVQ
ncbi:cupredoxin domain-containing protein [Candidatus Uhrbacteria bacterium]|nr:cupredoxin domain-containing protein [Candidatus Uhrbacteria bacterium]